MLTVPAERRPPPPPQRKKIAKSINYVKDLFVCQYLLQRCLKILRHTFETVTASIDQCLSVIEESVFNQQSSPTF